jgi:excisionase family DNA binding protein
MSWDDEYLTISELAERLKLNQQTVRNWIDQGLLPAARISRRVAASDERTLIGSSQKASTLSVEPAPSPGASAEARDQLEQALERARRLLGRQSAARRSELAGCLRELTDGVAVAVAPLRRGKPRRR